MKDIELKDKNNSEVLEILENGVYAVYTSEKFANYLKFLSKFHSYSYNNTLLIMLQNPNATFVAGYNDWKNKHKRYVKSGEKGIRILAPVTYKVSKDVLKRDENNQPIIKDGKKVYIEKSATHMYFKQVSVFDVSQTDGQPLKLLSAELTADVSNYDELFTSIKETTSFPIDFEDIKSGAKGYCDYTNNRIRIKSNMSQAQTIKTAIHEVCHARLHNYTNDLSERRTEEIQAESVAFVVSNHYGIDTSDYSFGYIASWSADKELEQLKESLEIIQKEANAIINDIDSVYNTLVQNKEQVKEEVKKEVKKEAKESVQVIDKKAKGDTLNQRVILTDIKETIATIKDRMTIVDYASSLGFTVLKVGNYYTLKEHDSVRINIDKNTFTQYSSGIYGDIIDFSMNFENLNKGSAINKLATITGAKNNIVTSKTTPKTEPQKQTPKETTEEIKQELILPQNSKSVKNIYAYLTSARKINPKIVSEWIKNKNLYQDERNNCVFVTYDKNNKPVFANLRSSNTSSSFKGDVKGSDYNICHLINNNANTLVISESVIDLMSLQTIFLANNKKINDYNYLSLNGTSKISSVINAINSSDINKIIIAVDNDKAGLECLKKIIEIAKTNKNKIDIVEFLPKNQKDWNAELVEQAKLEKSKTPLQEKVNFAKEKSKADNLMNKLQKENQKNIAVGG